MSLVKSFFGSFGGAVLGDAVFAEDAVFGNGCFVIAFALVGVRGVEVAVLCGLVSDASGAVDGADAATVWASMGAGGAPLGFGSGAGFGA